MTSDVTNPPETEITCENCEACCCRLQVMLITETSVPERFVERDEFGMQSMRRLHDGWCAALSRDTMACTIYEQRPLICREFKMGDYECIVERIANL